MRPQITHPASMKDTVNYNENKVKLGKAELIHAGNYLKQPQEMNFNDKMSRFEKLMELNHRAETKVMHVSLNFHPDDAPKLSREFLKQISDEYMQKIGFGNQPYLVYQHHDAAHPHVHIVTTLIQDNRKRIPTHNLAKNYSEPARKELEQRYGLRTADKQENARQKEQALKIDVQRVQAGKTPTKQGISNVVSHVIKNYKFTSLHELNAVLKQFNVQASRGKEEGRIYKNRGLLYSVIDENGKAVTKPIKASAFYHKPTLDNIEARYEQNKKDREQHKQRLKTAIDWAMQKDPATLTHLAGELEKERISIVARRSEDGKLYGLTYVDHETQSVFNGSDLEKTMQPSECSKEWHHRKKLRTRNLKSQKNRSSLIKSRQRHLQKSAFPKILQEQIINSQGKGKTSMCCLRCKTTIPKTAALRVDSEK